MPQPEGHDEVDVDAAVGGYDGWLTRQPLAARTREAYLAQVRDFVTWLARSEHGARALVDWDVRDWAVRDYKRYVKTTRRWGPASVNQALAAIDNFYRSRGAGRPEVAREELAQTAPRALAEAEQRSFLRFVAASPSARDRAIATVFFYGLRLSELVNGQLELRLAAGPIVARFAGPPSDKLHFAAAHEVAASVSVPVGASLVPPLTTMLPKMGGGTDWIEARIPIRSELAAGELAQARRFIFHISGALKASSFPALRGGLGARSAQRRRRPTTSCPARARPFRPGSSPPM